GRIAIGADDDKVVDQLPFEVDVTANEIVKIDRAALDFESDHVRDIARLIADRFRTQTASAGVAVRLASPLRRGAIGLELFDRAVTAIRLPGRDEILGAAAIEIEAVALIDRIAVPLDVEPLQRGDDLFGVMLLGSLDVGVLDAQQ